MRVRHLSLTNFRNYTRLEVSLPEGALLLCGQNAQGKTSLLESIYYLATSRSVWATSDRQLLNWRAEEDVLPYARITAEISNAQRDHFQLDITLIRQSTESGARLHKQIKINGLQKRSMDLLGHLVVVMFLPQDLAIIEGSPTDRRRYLNITLAQTDHTYAEALHTYEKVLEERNALLRQIAKRKASASELEFWDGQLTDSGAILIAGRQRLLRELEGLAQDVHRDLTNGVETLELSYLPNFSPTANGDGQLSLGALGLDLSRQLNPPEIAAQFREALTNRRTEELERGITLTGPQRDELRFKVNDHDLALYGSRGQARTAVMSIKLAELAWMRNVIKESPLLLLDEFLAELDVQRRGYLLDRIGNASQSILTTTEPDIFTPNFLEKSTVWRVHAGQILSD